MKCREATNKSALQFRQHRTHALLLFVQIQKFLFYRLAQFADVSSSDRVAHGDQHVGAGFNQYAFIDGQANLAFCFGLENQYSWRECRYAVKPVRQESKRAVASSRDNAQYTGFLGEDFEG